MARLRAPRTRAAVEGWPGRTICSVVIVYEEHIREALATLADVEYQCRVWTARGNKPGEMDSFEETLEHLYTDSGLADELQRGNRVFTPEIDQSLVALDELVAKVDTRRTPDALIEDPAMNDVRQLARDILRDLGSLAD